LSRRRDTAAHSPPRDEPDKPVRQRFRPDVEGLRAIAVALVVLYHASLPGVSAGYVGVDVFFVVSGFVITGLLLRERIATGRISLLNFYARRVRRILPAATLVTVVTVLATYQLLGAYAGPLAADDARWTLLFSANIHFANLATSYFAADQPPSPLQHMWSLGVEEQFYLVWPILIGLIALRARRARAVLLCAAVALVVIIAASYAYSIHETPRDPSLAFFSPFTRAFELGLGALVAVAGPALRRLPPGLSPWLGLAGIIGVVGSGVLIEEGTEWPGALVLVPTAATAMVIAAGGIRDATLVARSLGSAPLRWLGSRSYSLYLWHWPVLTIAAQRAGKPELALSQTLPLVGAAIVLAELSYRFVENPIRHSSWLMERPRVSIALAIVLLLSGLGAMELLLQA